MKSKLIAMVCAIFMVQGAGAQVGFQGEVLVGAGFFQVDGDHFAGYNKLGGNVGIGIYAPIKENLNLGFELLYAQKGSKLSVNPDDPNPRIFILQYDYLEIPLIVKTTKNKFAMEAGLAYGINVRSLMDEGAGFKSTTINKGETSYIIGAGLVLSETSSIMIRHQQSLFRVGNNYPNGLNIWNRIGVYNRGFVVQYRYSL
jgi:hypothetical protein